MDTVIEVKKAGKYLTRGGRKAEVYGFDDLGTGVVYAEGFLLDTREMCHWNPDNGKANPFGRKDDDSLDIVAEEPSNETQS